MTRVIETQRRAAIASDEMRRPKRGQLTFAERYRGTEFEAFGTTALRAHQALVSRGRQFVLVTGTTVVTLCGFVISAALSS